MTATSVTIRRHEAKDDEELHLFARVVLRNEKSLAGEPTPFTSQEKEQILFYTTAKNFEEQGSVSFVAVDEKPCFTTYSIVGHAYVRQGLVGFSVKPGWEHQGIGSRLLGELVAWANVTPGVDWLTSEIETTNAASKRIHEKNGFEHVNQIEIDLETGRGKAVSQDKTIVMQWSKAKAAAPSAS